MSPTALSLRVKIAGGLIVAGEILHGVAFAIPYWGKNGDRSIGLWQYCFDGECHSWYAEYQKGKLEGWFHGVQAASCLALITAVSLFVCLLAFLFLRSKVAAVISSVIGFVTAGLIAIAVVVFASHFEREFLSNLSFAFGFDIIAAFVFLLAGCVFFVEFLKLARTGPVVMKLEEDTSY